MSSSCMPGRITAPAITELDGDDFIFRTVPSDVLQGEVTAELELKTSHNTYGQQLSGSFVELFEELGSTVTQEEVFEPQQPSYTMPIQNALSNDPDALVGIEFSESGKQIFRNYYADFDGEKTIMVTDGLRDKNLPSNVNNLMENVIDTAPLTVGPRRNSTPTTMRSMAAFPAC